MPNPYPPGPVHSWIGRKRQAGRTEAAPSALGIPFRPRAPQRPLLCARGPADTAVILTAPLSPLGLFFVS